MKKIGTILCIILIVGYCIVKFVQIVDLVQNKEDMNKKIEYTMVGATPYLERAQEYIKAGNYSQAIPHLKKVNELVGGDDSELQFSIGVCYELTENHTQAAYWARKAAEQGYSWAQFALGLCYTKGKGVTKNDSLAAYWWRKAAEQGLAAAQYNLGFCYVKGNGVTQDYTQAVYWYRKAAEQGHAYAQNNLGYAYHHGEGVTKDDVQAVYWWRKAAEQGEGNAQGHLSIAYYEGTGVAKDLEQAKFWARKAIANEGVNPEKIKFLQEQVLQQETTHLE